MGKGKHAEVTADEASARGPGSQTEGQSFSLENLRTPNRPWSKVDSKLGGSMAFHIKERIQCRFEGGKKCRCEDPRKQHGRSAIEGVHSNWVTDAVLAMARTSDRLIALHNVMDQFNEHNITCIINLQEVGEHPHCGDGILPGSGFSYSPDLFMKNDVYFYNFSWRDMSTPQVSMALDIAKVMDYSIRLMRGKVAVHCHAGLGRTGLVIGCYLVYTGKYTAEEAIKHVRTHRHGALQTRQQVQFVHDFELYLNGLKSIYRLGQAHITLGARTLSPRSPTGSAEGMSPSMWSKRAAGVKVGMSMKRSATTPPNRGGGAGGGRTAVAPLMEPGASLAVLMRRQRELLHGEEARKLARLPKIVAHLSAGIIVHAHRTKDRAVPSMGEVLLSCRLGELGTNESHRLGSTRASPEEVAQVEGHMKDFNQGVWDTVDDAKPRVLVWLLVEWFRQIQDDVLPAKVFGAALAGPEPPAPLPQPHVERALHAVPEHEMHILASACGCMREIANSHLTGSRTNDVTNDVFTWLAHLLLTQKAALPDEPRSLDRIGRIAQFLKQVAMSPPPAPPGAPAGEVTAGEGSAEEYGRTAKIKLVPLEMPPAPPDDDRL